MKQSNGTRNEIGIELDREKIEREGEYNYDDLVAYLDTEFAKQGFVRSYDEDYLCYYSDEPNNFLKQIVCYSIVKNQPAVFKNLKGWQLVEYRNNDFVNPYSVDDALAVAVRSKYQPRV